MDRRELFRIVACRNVRLDSPPRSVHNPQLRADRRITVGRAKLRRLFTTDKWGRVCRLNRSVNSPNRENDRDSFKSTRNMAIGWIADSKAIRRTVLLDFDRKGMMNRMLAIVTTMPLFGRGVL